MSHRQTVDELIADAHAHGYGPELPDLVVAILRTLADGLDGKTPAAANPAEPGLADRVAALEQSLGDKVEQAFEGLLARLGHHPTPAEGAKSADPAPEPLAAPAAGATQAAPAAAAAQAPVAGA